jgi:eukaryotic-like serine/threonine-protein kinase
MGGVFTSDRAGGMTDIWVQDLRAAAALPYRLTSHPAADVSPAISPDGEWVAFRSGRDGGGIFMAPRSGGPATQLFADGYEPRFSPDGRSLVFSASGAGGPRALFVLEIGTRNSRHIDTPGGDARCPIWTPDGESILFLDRPERARRSYDWYVIPAFRPAAGGPQGVGLAEVLKRQRSLVMTHMSCPTGWAGTTAILKVDQVLTVPLSRRSWKVNGAIRTLLSAPAMNTAAISSDTTTSVVYGLEEVSTHIWSVPVDLSRGVATGEPSIVSPDAFVPAGFDGAYQSVSGDESTVAYVSRKSGNLDVWRLDLRSGGATRVTESAEPEARPFLTPDAAAILFLRRHGPGRAEIFYSDSGGERLVCTNCGVPLAWSVPGKSVFTVENFKLAELDLGSQRSTLLMHHPQFDPYTVSLSGDRRWIAFTVLSQKSKLAEGYICRFPAGLERSDTWIPIASERHHGELAWGPDANLIYYFSQADGHRCLYAQRLNPSTKTPAERPFVVQHFHGLQGFPMSGSRLAVARDRLILSLTSQRGNVWRAFFGQRPELTRWWTAAFNGR